MSRENRNPKIYRPRPKSSPARGVKIGVEGERTQLDKYMAIKNPLPKRDLITSAILNYAIQRLEAQKARHGRLIVPDEIELRKLKRLRSGFKLTAEELGYTEHLKK
jgi:hypothetical protein